MKEFSGISDSYCVYVQPVLLVVLPVLLTPIIREPASKENAHFLVMYNLLAKSVSVSILKHYLFSFFFSYPLSIQLIIKICLMLVVTLSAYYQ